MGRGSRKGVVPGLQLNTSTEDATMSNSGRSSTGSDDHAQSIRVAVRVRPENKRERELSSSKPMLAVLDTKTLIFDPAEDTFTASDRLGLVTPKKHSLLSRREKDECFTFDHVFGEYTAQDELFTSAVEPNVAIVATGYNATILAYGATGAGKTFTMLGTGPENEGVIQRTVRHLFHLVESRQEEVQSNITLSYLEVYNENIRDLLVHGVQPPISLDVREEAVTGIVVAGLSCPKVSCWEQVMALIERGNQVRSQGSTDANETSSRSHAVLQLTVQQKDKTDDTKAAWNVGKLTLVDLAGSERAGAVSRNCRSTMKEGCNINKSLLALGNCINALATGVPGTFVPYRDSKLTRLLKDSLGGNCRTMMIACVSPSTVHYEDTYNTLNYASRAKNIKTSSKKNVLNVDFHVSKYAAIIESLRQEVKQWKDRFMEFQHSARSGPNDAPPALLHRTSTVAEFDDDEYQAFENIKQEIVSVYDLKKSSVVNGSSDVDDSSIVRRCLIISKRIQSGEVKNPVLVESLNNLRAARVSEIETLRMKQQLENMSNPTTRAAQEPHSPRRGRGFAEDASRATRTPLAQLRTKPLERTAHKQAQQATLPPSFPRSFTCTTPVGKATTSRPPVPPIANSPLSCSTNLRSRARNTVCVSSPVRTPSAIPTPVRKGPISRELSCRKRSAEGANSVSEVLSAKRRRLSNAASGAQRQTQRPYSLRANTTGPVSGAKKARTLTAASVPKGSLINQKRQRLKTNPSRYS